jgi:hypothetical protein
MGSWHWCGHFHGRIYGAMHPSLGSSISCPAFPQHRIS